jgi:hypothetical protein
MCSSNQRRFDLNASFGAVGPPMGGLGSAERLDEYAQRAQELAAQIEMKRRASEPEHPDHILGRFDNAYTSLLLEYERVKRENLVLQRRLDAALELRDGGR